MLSCDHRWLNLSNSARAFRSLGNAFAGHCSVER